ncbi:zeta toxin family protein [Paenibacillus sp. 1781tsa1]|uniref:zeta toxin family protein n=1 Tax=Paenibacillus sp. 1781tsa1 TaxID=2953810 RepID=UPI0020A1208D|nr:zeta toxin family protein [Paenibacillus sp. 1781tsa1]MCP1181616.1 zeta toxin family protein [Paenibacillus sp. 1781tsa1]
MSETRPVMTVFAGTNGAGKSTLSMQMREWLGELVDPDQIARELKPENPRSADLSAGREAVKRIRSLIKSGVNFAIETTLSGSFVLKHMEIAKENNYEIVVYYIGLEDVQMHIDRVASRVEQGGHWIAEEDIRYRYGQSLKNLKPALAIADRVTIIDNTYEPLIVAEIMQSDLLYCVESIPAWANPVLVGY